MRRNNALIVCTLRQKYRFCKKKNICLGVSNISNTGAVFNLFFVLEKLF